MEKLFEQSAIKLFEMLKKPAIQLTLLLGGIVVVSVAAWLFYQTQTSPPQPLEFNHKVHVGLGVPCLYCHPGAWRQASAGLPTVQKCWACHGQLSKYANLPVGQWPEALQKLAEHVGVDTAAKDKLAQPKPMSQWTALAWVPVYQVPDFVHFNHRPHIAAGLNCENCHGDMSEKTVATVEQTVNMGWCLNCHRSRTENNEQNNPQNDPEVAAQLAEKRTKLIDCGTCHY